MTGPTGESNEVERLKALLFGEERDRLAAAADRIDHLETWIGDAPKLENAVAHILVEAFKRAELDRHRDLAMAVAPVVVAAIRAEIVNSRDMMVEALYPITGRLVTAAVANAFRDLIGAINQRIDALTSTNQWRLRIKALASGRSMAEVALAEARGAQCVRALLIERGGGRLLAQWRPQGAPDDNPDLIGGLIAAVTEFASAVFADRRGELRNLDLGASRVYLRASSRVILAAEMVGAVTPEQERTIDARFLALVDRNDRGDSLLDRDLADVAAPTPVKRAATRRLRWVIVGVIAAACLGLALRGPVYRWRKTADVDEAFAAAKASDPRLAAYPLAVSEDFEASTVDVRGLAPSRDDARKLVEALAPAAAPLIVTPHIEVVAQGQALEAVQGRLADVADALANEGAAAKAIADRVGAQEQANASLHTDLVEKFAALKADVAKTAEGASSALGAEVTALRNQSAKIEDALIAGQDAARVEDNEIAELGHNLGALHAHLDSAQGRSEAEVGDLGAKTSALSDRLGALQSTTAETARTLDTALAQARDNAAKTEDARAKLAALEAALAAARTDVGQKAAASSLETLKADLARVSTTLDTVKASDAKNQTQLAEEAERAKVQAAASAELKRRVDTLSEADARRTSRATTALDEMAAKVAQAKQAAADARSEVDQLRARLDASARALPEVARRSVVYFTEGDTLADPAAAGAALDRLVEAIKRTGEGVRVVGYGDEMGPASANSQVSTDRAAKIAKMLGDRGVPAAKAIPVGRGTQNPVSTRAASGSRNRRVVFEPLLPGEAP
jgi:outer membrane protein OmpA-like peptidoglycan-associated protein